jgi:hypothetical protein
MTIEILYLTAQMQRWLNVQVARHLEAQAARLKSAKGTTFPVVLKELGADGPGGSVGLDRTGMPEGCYRVDETVSIDTIDAPAARHPVAQAGAPDSENQTVRA